MCDTIDSISGHEFFGVLAFWDGKTPPKEVANIFSTDPAMPFQITSRDNVIIGAVADNGTGNYNICSDDGGENGAGACLLRLMEQYRIANSILVIFRKFGKYQLGPDRYRLFEKLASKLLDQMKTGMEH